MDPELCHVPETSQVCGCEPLHWAAPGGQTPTHAPDTHAWLVQADALPHWPLTSHASVELPTQRAAAGAHTPVQAPPTHA